MAGQKLQITCFASPDGPLGSLPDSLQKQYLHHCLADLGAASILEEPAYFDRDFLAEFSAFYGVSSAGYPNRCRRLHFFKGSSLSRGTLRSARPSICPHSISGRLPSGPEND